MQGRLQIGIEVFRLARLDWSMGQSHRDGKACTLLRMSCNGHWRYDDGGRGKAAKTAAK